MIITSIHKAQPVVNSKPVASAEISMSIVIPELTVENSYDFYQKEARRLATVLIETLPGGTLDQLIVYLLERKASLLRVPTLKPDKEKTKKVGG